MEIPNEIRRSVAFGGVETEKGFVLGGTVFFVFVPMDDNQTYYGYAVTAKHVIAKAQALSRDGAFYLRINVKNGPAQNFATAFQDWMYHPDEPDSVDVAILPLSKQDHWDYTHLPVAMAINDDVIKEEAIGAGTDVFLIGLFINHSGNERNLPIVRVGNIALMPEDKVRVAGFGDIDAYLVEARSIGGLSGSPVFASIPVGQGSSPGDILLGGQPHFYWLGLMHGHFEASADTQRDFVGEEVANMGIAIVVPASKVLEVINQGDLLKARRRGFAEYLKTKAAADAIADDS